MKWVNLRGFMRTVHGCPQEWRLTRAVSDGPDQKLGRHLDGCTSCAKIYSDLKAIVKVAPALSPADPMTDDSRERIAAMLLAEASAGERSAPVVRRARRLALGLAAVGVGAAAAIAGITVSRGWMRVDPSDHPASSLAGSVKELEATAIPSHASIRVIGEARFSRVQSPPDELVRLDDGTIELRVSPLAGNERFRVATGDAEVEVKGTHFKVTAARHALVAVHVWQGRVEVRSSHGTFTTLQAGDDWVEAPDGSSDRGYRPGASGSGDIPAPSLSGVKPDRSGPVSSTGSVFGDPIAKPERSALSNGEVERPPSAATPGTEDDSGKPSRRDRPAHASFDHAWTLLRKGDARRAALAFAEVQRLTAGTAIEEDALYWQAIAVGRLPNERPEACRLLRQFVERYPGSPRVGQANVALGWLLMDSGDLGAAGEAFGRATHDPSPRVRTSALEGTRRVKQGSPGQAHP